MNVEIVRQIRRFITSGELRAACGSPVDDMDELRSEFAQYVSHNGPFSCWQEAWNEWTHAEPHKAGVIHLKQRCPRCNGKGIDMRRATMCYSCVGRKRISTSVSTRYLTWDGCQGVAH